MSPETVASNSLSKVASSSNSKHSRPASKEDLKSLLQKQGTYRRVTGPRLQKRQTGIEGDITVNERNEPDTEESEQVDIRGYPLDENCDVTIGQAAVMIEQQMEQQNTQALALTTTNLDKLQGGVFKVHVPGYGYDRCAFKKLKDEEEAKKGKVSEKPIELILLESFLEDQRKPKIAE